MCFRQRHDASAAQSTNFLVVGLGNVGDEDAGTRHNMGFMMLDSWAQDSNIVFSPGRSGSMGKMTWKGRHIYLLKPSTYMNLSGNAIRYWLQKLKIPVSNLLVVCDDLNLPFGAIRMRKGGSDGGHNGLKNIQDCIGTQEYSRVRLGIGHDFQKGEQVDFVLGGLSDDEKKLIPEIASRVLQGVREFCTVGPDKAMSSINTKQVTAN